MSEFAASLGRLIRSPAFKFVLICFLILVLLIPMLLVGGLVFEREGRAREVRAEVAKVWGQPQQVLGPLLVVPYSIKVESVQGEKRVEQIVEKRAVFTPEQLDIVVNTASKVLHRGIYDAPVFSAKAAINGRFLAPDIRDVAAETVAVRWRDASLIVGLSDVSGLKQAAVLKINGTINIPFAPSLGIGASNQVPGIHVKLLPANLAAAPDTGLPAFSFHVDLDFSGSASLQFAPAARETKVAMTSDWASPSFSGAYLPGDRTVSNTGFTASWTVPHLARSVPQSWTLSEHGADLFQPYYFGVSFFQPVGFYDLVMRAVKYAVLFVTFAFMAVFVIELLWRKRVHPVQYLFVGVALIFFYVLLLSLAEHIGFGPAYWGAAAATGSMLATYVGRSIGTRAGLIMAGVFALLYGLLYLILRLEDYALLAGALVGFVTLTIVMFSTLNVDWSGTEPAKG